MTIYPRRARFFVKQISLLLVFLVTIGITIACTYSNMSITNSSTVAFIFLIIVVLSSFFSNLLIGIIISIVAALCFNYFYLLPIGTLNIYAFSDWITLFTFLITSIFISTITNSSITKTASLNNMQALIKSQNAFSAWLLCLSDDDFNLTIITQELVKEFKFDYCSVHIINNGKYNNLIGQSASARFEYPGKSLMQKDHSVDLADTIDEYDLDVIQIKIENGNDLHILFSYKANIIDVDFFTNLSYLISIRISKLVRFYGSNQP